MAKEPKDNGNGRKFFTDKTHISLSIVMFISLLGGFGTIIAKGVDTKRDLEQVEEKADKNEKKNIDQDDYLKKIDNLIVRIDEKLKYISDDLKEIKRRRR
jgi:hypothetical protein